MEAEAGPLPLPLPLAFAFMRPRWSLGGDFWRSRSASTFSRRTHSTGRCRSEALFRRRITCLTCFSFF